MEDITDTGGQGVRVSGDGGVSNAQFLLLRRCTQTEYFIFYNPDVVYVSCCAASFSLSNPINNLQSYQLITIKMKMKGLLTAVP